MPPPNGSFDWPTPRKGPDVPFKYETSSNPVLRGYILMALTTLIKSSSMIQGVLWRLNGFDKLKDLPGLDGYEPRYDPTVVPAIPDEETEVVGVEKLSVPAGRSSDECHYTVGDYHNAYLSGKLTPSEVVECLIPLIDRKAPSPSRFSIAFLELRADLVRAAAEASTERYRKGKPLSVLDGVPVAVKDEIDLQGHSRCLGSPADFTNPLDQTGWCVKKWEEAGAIILGKTTMHEVGMDTSGNNPSKGTPLNPFNTEYYCGGSSTGSAFAVASGICPIVHGADGGGSIRLPGSFCGAYGIKPTHGRVSSRPTRSLAFSVGVDGPIASDLESLVIAYRVMAQPDPDSRTSRSFPNSLAVVNSPASVSSSSSRKKILGIYPDWINRSDASVLDMFHKAVDFYLSQGYEVANISIPYIQQGQKAHALTILNEVKTGISTSQLHQLSYPNQLLMTVGAGPHATTQDFLSAQKIRNLLMEHLSWLWTRHPGMLIITPTTPCAGWKINHPSDVASNSYGLSDGDMSLRSMEFVFMANWTGCPALTRPMGYTEQEDIPVGIMAMSEWGTEEKLFDWARDGEGLLKNGARKPRDPKNWIDVFKEVKRM